MAASPNPLPWFETARIVAKYTQAAPAMAHLLTMRPSVLSSWQIAKIERFTASEAGTQSHVLNPQFVALGPRFRGDERGVMRSIRYVLTWP
jgi:hypothetical protein